VCNLEEKKKIIINEQTVVVNKDILFLYSAMQIFNQISLLFVVFFHDDLCNYDAVYFTHKPILVFMPLFWNN
jgi:hypothetical protein